MDFHDPLLTFCTSFLGIKNGTCRFYIDPFFRSNLQLRRIQERTHCGCNRQRWGGSTWLKPKELHMFHSLDLRTASAHSATLLSSKWQGYRTIRILTPCLLSTENVQRLHINYLYWKACNCISILYIIKIIACRFAIVQYNSPKWTIAMSCWKCSFTNHPPPEENQLRLMVLDSRHLLK